MALINSILFFGFPVDETFAKSLAKNKPEYLSLFIHNDEAYLKEVNVQGVRYLGKYINNEVTIDQLKLLEVNIVSLLKKLVADYDYQEGNLMLFAFSQSVEA
jgi:hypothetical protein